MDAEIYKKAREFVAEARRIDLWFVWHSYIEIALDAIDLMKAREDEKDDNLQKTFEIQEGEIRALTIDRDLLREAHESISESMWDGYDMDGGDWQDEMERLGLIVKVPADEDFKAAWDTDEMFVLAWSERAKEEIKP